MMRSRLITSVSLTLLSASLLLADEAPQKSSFSLTDAKQKWFGSIETGGPKLRMLIEVEIKEDGTIDATAFSLDQGNAAIPIETLSLADGKLVMDVPKVKGAYEGKLAADGNSAEGLWTQAGRDMPLNLRRVAQTPTVKAKEAWKGTLAAGAMNLEIQFRIVDGADGEDEVFFDSLTQMQNGFGATMQPTDDGMVFEVPVIRARFEGTYDESRSALEGTWTQAGNEIDLKLIKTDPADPDAAAKPKRPQHPEAPFPYDTEEITFANEPANITLAGTLTLPKEGGPFPAVVLVSGSGPQDRDESILGHKPFLVVADHLTKDGIAVLRFDDRGVGESGGEFASATSADFASDAAAAIEFLKTDERLDANRLGIVGHSEGGLIATILAAQRDDLAHVVLLAGPGIPGDEILVTQAAAIKSRSGLADEEALQLESEALADLLTAIKTDAAQEERDEAAARLVELQKGDEELSEEGEASFAQMATSQLSQFETPWFKYFIKYDPREDLSRVKCPVLAMIGEHDLQVLVDPNLTAIEEALQQSSISDYRCEQLAGLNHLFQETETGLPTEYSAIEETFSPRALTMISEWVQSH